jgi:hypothetical protein
VKKAFLLIPVALTGLINFAYAQLPGIGGGQIHGNFQFDAAYYNPDSLINAPVVPEKALSNGFGNIIYTNGKFMAGVRYEHYLNVMQGFPVGYKGTGIPYRFATYNNDKLEITVGSSYDQFGGGLVYRAYEERGLGYDNALDGMRIRWNARPGLYIKGIWGKQRNFFSTSPGIVRGIDGEINLNEFIGTKMDSVKTTFIIGGNFVSKYQLDNDPTIELPQNVGAWSFRSNVITERFNIFAEYAYKINDPTIGNNYTYKEGQAVFLSATYAQKGLGISVALKQVDNFGFRSDRNATGISSMINYLPALTKQHTYQLAAFYPYATQPNGENGVQAEVGYKFKKGTKLGGKYGTSVTLNYGAAYGLSVDSLHDELTTSLIYKTNNFELGQLYFQDINIEIYKKFSPKFKGTFLYSFNTYNKNVIEGKYGYPLLESHIAVLDLIFTLNDKLTFRTDLEHMYAKHDFGSWALALAELTIGEHWFVAAMDQWNYGNKTEDLRIHYVNTQVGYYWGTNRIVLGYGKQRAGIFCVGGVCRFVPASNGFAMTITSSF